MTTPITHNLSGPIIRKAVELDDLWQEEKEPTIDDFNQSVVTILNGHRRTINTIYGEGVGAKLKRKGNSGYCCYAPPTDPERVSTSVWSGVKGFFRTPITSFPCSQSVHNRWHARIGENLGEILGKNISQIPKQALIHYYTDIDPKDQDGEAEINKVIIQIAKCLEDFIDAIELTREQHVVVIPSGHMMLAKSAIRESKSNNPYYPPFSMTQVRETALPIGMRAIILKHHLKNDSKLQAAISPEEKVSLEKTAVHFDEIIFQSFQAEYLEMLEDIEKALITGPFLKRRREEMGNYLRDSGNGHIAERLGLKSSTSSKRELSHVLSTHERYLDNMGSSEEEESEGEKEISSDASD